MTNKERKVIYDCLMSGTGISVTARRKWWNPMRWFKGEIYMRRVKPKNFYG